MLIIYCNCACSGPVDVYGDLSEKCFATVGRLYVRKFPQTWADSSAIDIASDIPRGMRRKIKTFGCHTLVSLLKSLFIRNAVGSTVAVLLCVCDVWAYWLSRGRVRQLSAGQQICTVRIRMTTVSMRLQGSLCVDQDLQFNGAVMVAPSSTRL